MSIAEAIEQYIRHIRLTKSPQTLCRINCAFSILSPFLEREGADQMPDLTRDQLQRFLLELIALGKSKGTNWTYAQVVRSWLLWCEEQGVIDRCPIRAKDLPKKPEARPEPLTFEQMKAVLGAAAGQPPWRWLAKRNLALLITMLDTGLRRGEVCRLRVGHFATGVFEVVQKGDRLRSGVVHPDTAAATLDYIEAYERETGNRLSNDDAAWRNVRNEPLQPNGLRRVFTTISREVGFRVWPHRLRATSATWRFGANGSEEVVRMALGHSNLRSIKCYVRALPEDVRRLLIESSPINRLLDR